MERDGDDGAMRDFGVESSMAFATAEGSGLRGQLGNVNQFIFPAYDLPSSGSQFGPNLLVGNELLGAESGSFSEARQGFSCDNTNSIPNSTSNIKTVVGVSSVTASKHSNTFYVQTESFHPNYMASNFYSASELVDAAFPFNSTTLPATSEQALMPPSSSSVIFYRDECSDVNENKNLKGRIGDSVPIQSTESNTFGTLQISRQLMVHPPMEGFDDDLKETELKLIIRKELSNSDVGTVGRIVLPKKEAEANLPPLVEREGIILKMDDVVLPVTWKFKYRFWPNNKSRMYIMESTGDFVKAHGLQAGDCFIIYRNSSSENYAVRGMKGVRLPPTVKALQDDWRNKQRESSYADDIGILYSSQVDSRNNGIGFHQFSQNNSFAGLLPWIL